MRVFPRKPNQNLVEPEKYLRSSGCSKFLTRSSMCASREHIDFYPITQSAKIEMAWLGVPVKLLASSFHFPNSSSLITWTSFSEAQKKRAQTRHMCALFFRAGSKYINLWEFLRVFPLYAHSVEWRQNLNNLEHVCWCELRTPKESFHCSMIERGPILDISWPEFSTP